MFIPLGTTWPSLNEFEFQFNGLTFGGINNPDNDYQLQAGGITGLGVPKFVTGDAQRPLRSGEFAGYDVAGGRDIVLQVTVKGDSWADLEANLRALTAVMAPQGNVETPLFFRRGDTTIYGIMARPRDAAYSIDPTAVQAFATIVTMQFHSTDWRIYTQAQSQVHAVSTTPASMAITTGGDVFTNPIIQFSGGATGHCQPLIDSLDNSFYLDFTALTMAPTDLFVVDTDLQTALYTQVGNPPSKVRSKLAYSPPLWGPLPASATTTIQPSSADAGTGFACRVIWADAYAGV